MELESANVTNLNCSYALLDLLHSELFASSQTDDSGIQSVRRTLLMRSVNNQLGQDVQLTFYRVLMNRDGKQKQRLVEISTVAVRTSDRMRFTPEIDLSRSPLAVGITGLEGHWKGLEGNVSYTSEANILLNQESASGGNSLRLEHLVLSMRSQGLHPSRRFVVVHVTTQPLTLTLESPIRLCNQTKQTLEYRITADESIEEAKRQATFSVEPNASQFLPFYLGEKPFSLSIQCNLPSLQPSSSVPVASIPFCTRHRKQQSAVSPMVFQCSPKLSVLMAGESHEWFCCCKRESRSLDGYSIISTKMLRSQMGTVESVVYNVTMSSTLTLQNTLHTPVNYVIETLHGDIAACGVVPSLHSVPIHSTDLALSDLVIRVSLWGCDYCEAMPFRNLVHTQRLQLPGRLWL